MPLIAGSVRDGDGLPVVRVVRVYRRDSGTLLGASNSAGGPEVPADASYSQVTTLCRFYGVNGDISFPDDKKKIWGVLGNAQLSTAQSLHGPTSMYFDGTGDSILNSKGGIGNFGTGDFTVELLLFLVNGGHGSAWSRIMETQKYPNPGGWAMVCAGSTAPSALRFDHSNGSSFIDTGSAVSDNVWHHIAVTRSSGTLRIFVDGALKGSVATSVNFTADDLSIGGNISNGESFRGYIDSIRITKGVARYTGNFTPPSAEFQRGEAIPERALGEYAISVPYSAEVQVICLDDDVGTLENDLVLRTIPV